MKQKILIAAPTSESKDYCFLDYIKNVNSIRKYAEKQDINTDFIIVDNSDNPEHIFKIRNAGINGIPYNNPSATIKYKIAVSMKIIYKKFMQGNYTHLFILETDQFPPKNVLQIFLSFKKNVISLPYFIGYGKKSELLMYSLIKDDKTKQLIFSKVPPEEQTLIADGSLIKGYYNNGLGCTLIGYNVLKKVKFRFDKEVFTDTLFYTDIIKQGIENYIYTGEISLHRNGNWDFVKDYETLKTLIK